MPSYDYGGNASRSYWRRCGDGASGGGASGGGGGGGASGGGASGGGAGAGGGGASGGGSKERNTGPCLLPYPPPSSYASHATPTNPTLDQSFPPSSSSSSRDYRSGLPRSYNDSCLGSQSRHSVESGYDHGPSSLQFGDDSRLYRSGYDDNLYRSNYDPIDSSLPSRSDYEDWLHARVNNSPPSSYDSRPQYRAESTSGIVSHMIDSGYGQAGFQESSSPSAGGNYRDEILGYRPEMSASASVMRPVSSGGGGGGAGYNSIPGLLDWDKRRSEQDYPMQDSFGPSSRMSRGDGLLGMQPERERLDMGGGGGGMRRTASDFMGGGYGGQHMDNRASPLPIRKPPLEHLTPAEGRQAWAKRGKVEQINQYFKKTILAPKSKEPRRPHTSKSRKRKKAPKKPMIWNTMNYTQGKSSTYNGKRTTNDDKKAVMGDENGTPSGTPHSKTDSGDTKKNSNKNTKPNVPPGIPPSQLFCYACNCKNFETVQDYRLHLKTPDHIHTLRALNNMESSVLELLLTEAKLASAREIDTPFDPTKKCPDCEVYMNVPDHITTLEHSLVTQYRNVKCCKMNFTMGSSLQKHRLTVSHQLFQYKKGFLVKMTKYEKKRMRKKKKHRGEQVKKQRLEEEAFKIIKKAHDDLKDLAEEDKDTSENLPPYDPEKPVGIHTTMSSSYYKCNVCPEVIKLGKEKLFKRHFHSFQHYLKLCDYVEKLEELEMEAGKEETTKTEEGEKAEEELGSEGNKRGIN